MPPPQLFLVWKAGLVLLAGVYPFIAVCRGRPVGWAILSAWGLLLLYTLLVCDVLPLVALCYDQALAARLLSEDRSEFLLVFLVLIVGWFYPLVASVCGYTCRQLWLCLFKPRPPGA